MADPTARTDAAPARPPGSSGLAAAVTAFAMWGVFPLYLKPLSGVPALQVMSHRIVWCCVVVFGWLAARRELSAVGAALRRPATRSRLAASAVCISINWLIYTWAVTNGHVVDASLGYFINPLVSVVLGVAVLHERLNRVQWTAVAIAGAGVLYLAVALGRPPWIALALAASFGMYGLIRKVVQVDSVPGLATETLLVAPLAAAYLLWCESQGSGALGHSTPLVNALLLLSGVVTATPLALFAYGARRIPLSMVGLVQYIGPTLQFLIGVFVFGEAFPPTRAIGFAMIWSALVVYAGDGLWRRRAR
ncbi:MAG: EamA family transporter RarD [Steroidobacteraceae bacterium]